MKTGSFSALLVREWMLAKKTVVISLISIGVLLLFTLLVYISFKSGNLALLAPETKQYLITEFGFLLKFMPTILTCSLAMIPSDSAAIEATPEWERFRRSVPVTSKQFAFSKSVVFAIGIVLSLGLSLAVGALLNLAVGTNFTVEDVAFTFALVLIITAMSAFMQIAITRFKSSDKAGILMTAFLVPIMIIVMIVLGKNGNSNAAGSGFEALKDLFVKLFPVVPFLIIGIIALQFLLLAKLYERREK